MSIGFLPTVTSTRPTQAVTNDGFFPDLSLEFFASNFGVPTDISNDQLKNVLLIAMGQVNQGLADFKAEKQSAGVTRLVDISNEEIGGTNLKQLHYMQAVYSKAKAHLVREQIALDRKPNAESQAKTSGELVTYYETQASAGIANVLSRRLIGVVSI